MIATRLTRRQEQAAPAPRRDPIGWLLLTGIEDSDAWVKGHEKTVFVIVMLVLLFGSAL